MQIDAKKLLRDAKKNRSAIPAFNVSSLEGVHSIFMVAAALKKPVIIETSEGEANHFTPEVLAAICQALDKIHNVDYVLHLDRGKDLALIERCLKAGYNSIASEFGSLTYEENVKNTKIVRELTDKYNAQLEGAIEVVPLRYYMDKFQKEMLITVPEVAKEFVAETGVDSLVVSIGTQSGRYKTDEKVRIDILAEVNKLLPDMPLVLHGGSFMPDAIIKECIDNGIAKINVNSENRIAYTNTLKANIAANPDEYAPYRLLAGTIGAMNEVIKTKINLFANTK